MADYDLGKAHGKIEIETDFDERDLGSKISKAESSIGRLRSVVQRIEDAFSRFEKEAKRASSATDEAGDSFSSASEKASDLDSSLKKIKNSAEDSSRGMAQASVGAERLEESLEDVKSAAESAQNSIDKLSNKRVHVNVDVDVDRHTLAMARFASSLEKIETAGLKLTGVLASVKEAIGGVSEKISSVTDTAKGLSETLLSIGSEALKTGAKMSGLSGGMEEVKGSATTLYQKAMALRGALLDLKTPIGLVTALTLGFRGFSEQLKTLPQFAQEIVRLNAGLGALKSSWGALNTHAERFLGARILPYMAAMGGAAVAAFPALRTLGNNIRLMTIGLGLAYPAFGRAVIGANSLGRAIGPIAKNFGDLLGGMSNVVLGTVIFKNGLASMKKALQPLIGMLPQLAIGVLALGALGPIGSIVLGAANALKQLSGIALVLPSGLAMIGAAGATMMIAIKGISGAFSAAFGDADKFDEAVKDMGPKMKAFATELKGLKEPFQTLQKEVAATSFDTVMRSFVPLAEKYIPLLKTGMLGIGEGINQASGGFVSFLSRSETMNALGTLFDKTAVAMKNLAKAVEPVLIGLQEIGLAGTEYLSGITAGAGGAAHSFAAWAKEARETGKIKDWIEDSVQGFKDLGSVISDVGGAVKDIFEAFGGDGSDALQRLAEGAEKMRTAVSGSLDGGTLGEIVSQLQDTSTRIFSNILIAAKELFEVLTTFRPLLSSIGEGFGTAFEGSVPIIGAVAKGIGFLTQGLNAMGLGQIIGMFAALALAIKAVTYVVAPLWAAIKMLTGGALILNGLQNAFIAVGTAANTMAAKITAAGVSSTRINGILARVSRSMMLMATMISGPVVAAVMLLVSAFIMFKGNADENKRKLQEIRDEYDRAGEAARRFGELVREANGKITSEALDKAAESVSHVRAALEKKSENKSGFLDKLGDVVQGGASTVVRAPGALFGGGFSTETFGDTKTSKNKDAAAESAERVKKAIEELGMTNEEFAQILTSSDGSYENLIARLGQMGNGGKNAISEFQFLRNEFEAQIDASNRIGESNLKISNGIRTLASESSSASEKLSALKDVLEGLGIIQTSALVKTAEWTQKVKQFKEEAVSMFDGMDTSEILKADGSINALTQAGSAMTLELEKMADEFLATALQTGDAEGAYRQLIPSLEALAQSSGIPIAKIKELAEAFGLVPSEVQILVGIEGLSAVQADLLSVYEQLRRMPEKKKVSIDVGTADVKAELERIGVQIDDWNPETKELTFTIPEGNKSVILSQLSNILGKKGVTKAEIEAVLKPGATESLDKALKKNNLKVPVRAELQDGEKLDPTKGTGDKKVKVSVDDSEVKTKVEGVKNFVNGLPADKRINIVLGGGDHLGIIGRIKAAVDGLPSSKTVRIILGGGDHLEIINRIRSAVGNLPDSKSVRIIIGGGNHLGIINSINEAIAGLRNKTVAINISGNAKGALGGIATEMTRVGTAAQNMSNRISAAANGAVAAINRIRVAINSVRSTFQSVAGSAFSSGLALGQGFANGIRAKIPAVQQAAMDMATAASRPLPSSPAKIGPFSGKGWTPFRGRALAEGFAKGIHAGSGEAERESLAMTLRISNALDAVRLMFNMPATSFDANREPGIGGKKYYRDPEISDADLRKKRLENEKERKQQEEDDAYRLSKKAAQDLPEQENETRDALDRVTDLQKQVKDREKTIDERTKKLNEAKTAKDRKEAEESLRTAREDLQTSKSQLSEAQVSAKNSIDDLRIMKAQIAADPAAAQAGLDSSRNQGGKSGQEIDSFIKSMDSATYGMGQFSNTIIDCSGFVSAVVNTATGRPAFSSRASTANMREWLKERGFKDGRGGPGDLRVGWWDKGGGANGHTALTTPSGLNAESTTGGVRFGKGAAGSNDKQFDNFMYLPIRDSNNLNTVANNSNKTVANTKKTAESTTETIPLIKNQDGTYTSSDPEWAKLIKRESGGNAKIVQKIQDANSGGNEASGLFQIAKGTWTGAGGAKFSPTAAEATPEQQAEIAAKIFKRDGGSPWGAGLAGRESEAGLRAGIKKGTGTGTQDFSGLNAKQIADLVKAGETPTSDNLTAEEQLEQLRGVNKKLDTAIKTAQNRNSSDAQVIRSLQDLDDIIATTRDPDIRDQIKSIRETTMDERGIKEYDPKENAPETPEQWFKAIFEGILKNGLSLINTLEEGMNGAINTAKMLIRGFSNTDDVNNFVDSVQSMSNVAMSIVSTVGSIASTVASISAAVGQAIPGVGQVLSAVSSVTGVVGNVNAVVDFAQDVFKMVGRVVGGGLSSFLGMGGTGQLQGQIRTLMDLNDGTIKTWSDRNAADKSVMGLSGGRDPNQTSAVQNLNIYQGPGQDPAEMMNNAMFAVSAHSQGVYAG